MTREEAIRVYGIIQQAQDAAMLSVTAEGLQGYTGTMKEGESLAKSAHIQYELWTHELENLTGLTIDELEQLTAWK